MWEHVEIDFETLSIKNYTQCKKKFTKGVWTIQLLLAVVPGLYLVLRNI